MFKTCFRCTKCEREMDVPTIPHFQSSLHLSHGLSCHGRVELVIVATLDDSERGPTKRGWVPRDDFMSGSDWTVDGQWEDPPEGTLQVACVPLPKEGHRQ